MEMVYLYEKRYIKEDGKNTIENVTLLALLFYPTSSNQGWETTPPGVVIIKS
mgnify:CR=1 FL=1